MKWLAPVVLVLVLMLGSTAVMAEAPTHHRGLTAEQRELIVEYRARLEALVTEFKEGLAELGRDSVPETLLQRWLLPERSDEWATMLPKARPEARRAPVVDQPWPHSRRSAALAPAVQPPSHRRPGLMEQVEQLEPESGVRRQQKAMRCPEVEEEPEEEPEVVLEAEVDETDEAVQDMRRRRGAEQDG